MFRELDETQLVFQRLVEVLSKTNINTDSWFSRYLKPQFVTIIKVFHFFRIYGSFSSLLLLLSNS